MTTLPRLQIRTPFVKDDLTLSDQASLFIEQLTEAIENALNSTEEQQAQSEQQEQELESQQQQLQSQQQQNNTTLALVQRAIQAISTPVNVALSAAANASNSTISISAHMRVYLDKTAVNVNAGSIAGVPFSTTAYVYYDDPNRVGGSVTYQYSTNPFQAVASYQNINRHYVGSIYTPGGSSSGTTTGGGAVPPGQQGNYQTP